MITKEKVKNEIDRIPDNLLEDIYSYIQNSIYQEKKPIRDIHTYKLKGHFDNINIRAKAYEKTMSGTKKLLVLLLSIVLTISSAQAASVETLSIHSKKMGKKIPATLILPDSYNDDAQRFPVLYLLHGAGDPHTKWNDSTDVASLSDEFDIIILCPDGGRTSWYFDSPIDPKYQYETFVAKECVTYIDKNYRTKAHRDYRALCGNSMGGHGAMFLAIRHKDVFSITVALSGGVDIRPFPNNWEIKHRIGSIMKYKGNWEKYTVINLAKELQDGELAISLDCGEKDFFLGVNRALHSQLLKDGITHEYVEKPGNHTWNYWAKAIKRQMLFIDKNLKLVPKQHTIPSQPSSPQPQTRPFESDKKTNRKQDFLQ